MKHTFLLFIIICLLNGCMSSLKVQVLVPADIMLPENIKKVVVGNRFKPDSDKNKIGNVLEGIITGEGIGVDREGADRAVSGLVTALTKSPKFTVVQTNEELKGTGTGAFPPPLDISTVQRICNHSGADALIVMCTFDSDSHTEFNIVDKKSKDSEGKEIIEKIHVGHRKTTATAGWRIYHKKDGQILDEFKISNSFDSDVQAKTIEDARLKLITQTQAVVDAGYRLGEMYAPRISPTWVWVQRSYYTGKKPPEMKKAKSYVITNDWKGAAQIWQGIVINNPDLKIKGKAAYNLALANEVDGNLESAIEWCRKSANEFGNKKARSYVKLLEDRLSDQKRLNSQMGGH